MARRNRNIKGIIMLTSVMASLPMPVLAQPEETPEYPEIRCYVPFEVGPLPEVKRELRDRDCPPTAMNY